jgi:hypothetical protein
MATQPPALECACTVCDVVGWKLPALDSTVYICGIRCLAEFDDIETKKLRKEWKQSMAGVPWVQSMNQAGFEYRDEAFRRAAGEASDYARTVSAAALTRAVHAGGYHGTGRAFPTCHIHISQNSVCMICCRRACVDSCGRLLYRQCGWHGHHETKQEGPDAYCPNVHPSIPIIVYALILTLPSCCKLSVLRRRRLRVT